MFNEEKKYFLKNGNLLVSKRYVTENGYTLGLWIATQRWVYAGKINGILTAEQIKRLECIGMRWDNRKDIEWQKFYAAAKKYYKEHGNLKMPDRYVTGAGIRLGVWLNSLRRAKCSNNVILTHEQELMLNDVGMTWDLVYHIPWEQSYNAARKYYDEHGNIMTSMEI